VVLPRRSAGGRSQSDCTFPENVGSSHNMSYNGESHKGDRVSMTLESELGAKKVKCS
jgi:hypothetical protein